MRFYDGGIMLPEDEVRQTLELRYYDLRRIIAAQLKEDEESENVDKVTEWAVSKSLRLARKFDPQRGGAWNWVMMVTWGCVQRHYRPRRAKQGKAAMRGDAMERVMDTHWEEGSDERKKGNFVEIQRPPWKHDAEEDCIITAIDVKKGWRPDEG